MRGVLKLKEVFVSNDTKRKGRSCILIKKRNKLLVTRFCYYSLFTKMGYEQIVSELSEELLLSQSTVSQLLYRLSDEVISLKKSNPPISYFKKEFPYFNWRLKDVKTTQNGR